MDAAWPGTSRKPPHDTNLFLKNPAIHTDSKILIIAGTLGQDEWQDTAGSYESDFCGELFLSEVLTQLR